MSVYSPWHIAKLTVRYDLLAIIVVRRAGSCFLQAATATREQCPKLVENFLATMITGRSYFIALLHLVDGANTRSFVNF